MQSLSELSPNLLTKKFWKEFALMTLGMFFAAAAVYYFLMPSKLVVGSISGLSIVIGAIFEQIGIPIKVSVVVFVINAILLVMAYFLIDSEFGVKTAYTALILGPMLEVWEWICPYQRLVDQSGPFQSVMGDIWFDLICFVLLLSASQAILFNINASTGGLDILAKIVNKYLHCDIGLSITVAGVAICCTAFAVNPFRLVVMGLIGTWINGLVVDYFMASLNRRKRVCIISEECDRIREYIVTVIGRSCTLYEITGGVRLDTKTEIQCLITQTEFAALRKWLNDNNIRAFMTAGNVSEVYGSWIKHERSMAKMEAAGADRTGKSVG